MALKYKSTDKKEREPKSFSKDDPLPPSVQSYLSSSVGEGERNRALFDAAGQVRDIGETQSEALSLLGPKALADGLPATEIAQCVESAYRMPPRESPRSAGGNSTYSRGPKRKTGQGRSYTIKKPNSNETPAVRTVGDASPIPVPKPIEKGGFEKFIKAAFKEGEGVCISRAREHEDGSITPDKGVAVEREKWLEKLRRKKGDIGKVESTKLGLFIRMNPMTPVSKRKKGEDARNLNEDVTVFRHVLVEFDTDSEGDTIPKDKQFGMMLASDLPITAVIDSGNKSLHAWVRVDAENAEQYKERADIVYALFPDVDSQNHNPNRLSRAPDGFRTVNKEVKRQRLLSLNLGAPNFESWEALNEAKSQGESWSLDDLLKYDVKNDSNSVIGDRWLCKGGSLVIVAPSGVGKSSLTSQLALGWSLGNPLLTFGIKAIRPLKQLILQAENDIGDVAEGIQGIWKGNELNDDDRKVARQNLFFRRITTLTGEDFLHAVEGFVNLHRPDICWIDPLLNFIGADISKQEVVSEFFSEGLSAISLRTGVIFALIHHTGKPMKPNERRGLTATDLAYAGLGSSALTNIAREVMVLTRLETEDGELPTFSLTATKRRTRAGMKTMTASEDGAPSDGHPTAEIYIRHAVGRIAWEQCPKPEQPESENKTNRKAKQSSRPTGRPSSVTAEQKLDIAEAVSNNGGNPHVSQEVIEKLARKLGKHERSIRRYLDDVAVKQKAARAELKQEGAIK